MIGFGFLFQQCRRIAQQILERPLLAEEIKPANPLPVDYRGQAGVLHQAAPFFDDSDIEAFQTRCSCASLPVKNAQF